MKILFVTSEALPLMKTGGLADVCGSLPVALKRLRHDVRLVMPAYREAVARAGELRLAGELTLPGSSQPVRLLEGMLPGTRQPVYLVDSPPHFYRPGGPYTAPDGHDWPDNAQRFALFCRAATAIALDDAGLGWAPQVVHCHDWQSGLVPALLDGVPKRPTTVFTIHNLSYQGLFSWADFQSLGLPPGLWSADAMEFYGRFSFIKGGIAFADWLTTVSPSYAREIRTPEYGFGLEGLLEHRAERLVGILNGVDYQVWDPAHDGLIEARYSADDPGPKAQNKAALQRELGLPQEPDVPLIGHVGRLVEQKGVDLLLNVLPQLMARGAQVVVLGSGQRSFEEALGAAAAQYARRLAVHIGYSERLAHRVEAGADLFVMPSRFEPCGLNQIYSLRYGAVPVVHRTGGLADTVVDTTQESLTNGTATGFVFDQPSSPALWQALTRAMALYGQPKLWRQLMDTGMRQDFSWGRSARQYLELYRRRRPPA